MGSFTGFFLPIFGSFLGDFFWRGHFCFYDILRLFGGIFGRSMNASLSEIMQKYKNVQISAQKRAKNIYANLHKISPFSLDTTCFV